MVDDPLLAPSGTSVSRKLGVLDYDSFAEALQACETLGLSFRASSELVTADFVRQAYPSVWMSAETPGFKLVRMYRVTAWFSEEVAQ